MSQVVSDNNLGLKYLESPTLLDPMAHLQEAFQVLKFPEKNLTGTTKNLIATPCTKIYAKHLSSKNLKS